MIFTIYKNKPKDWFVNSLNPLYLIINKVFYIVGEENDIKYLKIEKNHSEPVLDKWNQVFDSIKFHIKKLVMKKSILMMILTKLNLLVMIL